MNNLQALGESVRDTLCRLRDKHAFLHQHKRYYLNVRSRLLELNSRIGNEIDIDIDEKDEGERVSETGLEFADIIISTKRRIFVSIGYEYFVERSREEAVAFADDKLRLISEAIIQFDGKIEEAKLTEKRIKELVEKGDDFEDEYAGDEEEGLPAMEIREELDDDGNVINSSITPSASQKTRKELEKTLLGQSGEDEAKDKSKLSDFEKNLKGKLVRKEEERKKKEEQENERERERERLEEDRLKSEGHHVSHSQIDMENMYTFEDLVKEMDERDEWEDELGSDEFLQSVEEEENDDDDEMGYSVIPGSMAQSAFMEQIKKLRRERLPPPKSILKSKSRDTKPKKSVGFAQDADIHEVENLKDANKSNAHNPLLQIDEDGTILSKQEFDSDLFTKLIGAQGPDEIHEKYRREVETRQEQEEERAQSKTRVSRFKLQREGREKPVDAVAEGFSAEREEPVSDVLEEEEPVSDIVEREEPVSDILEKEEPVSDTSERNAPATTPSAINFSHQKSHTLNKPLNSLHKPKKKQPPQKPKIEELSDEDEGQSPAHSSIPPSTNLSEPSEHFPPEVSNAAKPPQKPIVKPNVDYRALGDDLDDMARAYTLGVYDDDLHDDPGTLLEKLDDFKSYNKQVQLLQDDIKQFRLTNSMQGEFDYENDSEDDNAPLMGDVVERDLPLSYEDLDDQEQDLSLHPDKLNESIALEYRRFKESLRKDRFADYESEMEPIDEWGNPLKPSRFRSQRFNPAK